MKRVAFLLVPLMLLVALGVVVIAEMPGETGLPAGCQSRLGQYIAHAYPPGRMTVQAAERAGNPENLSRDSGCLVFGDSVYYQTDDGPAGNEAGGPMPLPFPPKELWCVLLEEEGEATGRTSYAIVFVGLHMDMYSADWLVHEGPRDLSTPGLVESLSRLGCDLDLDEMGPRYVNSSGG